MKLFVTIFTILFCAGLVHAQDCSCVKLNTDENTRQGYSETIVFKEKKPFKILHGTAIYGADDEPLEDVFVEVFVADRKEPKRVAGCRTSTDGKFCFVDLAKGKYILRFSKSGGFKITEINVNVSPKSKRNEEITGFVQLGT